VSALGQGSLATFVRLQECNLRCKYCDTKYAQKLYKKTEDISVHHLSQYFDYGTDVSRNITITGGEPLLQKEEVLSFAKIMKEKPYTTSISIETNGSHCIPYSEHVDCWVADWKGPSSGMRDQMCITNFVILRNKDFIKFVIADEKDFEDAEICMEKIYAGDDTPRFVFSPMFVKSKPKVNLEELTLWMRSNDICLKTSAILNIQIHKIVGVA
jgi:7-carboxy-7-deazaguanine synthase